ncbi:unnamed protein product, partial [Linum tenue]
HPERPIHRGGHPKGNRGVQILRRRFVQGLRAYASSTWCLDELAQIVDHQSGDDRALPVFYHLSPSGVSDLSSGCYKRDLDRHKEKFTYVRVNRWRLALKSIADIAGWVLSDHQYVLVLLTTKK